METPYISKDLVFKYFTNVEHTSYGRSLLKFNENSLILASLAIFSPESVRPRAVHSPLIVAHNDAPQSVGLLWTCD